MSEGKRTKFIVNPAAANGRAGRSWAGMTAEIESRLGGCDWIFTHGPGDAEKMTRAALKEGFDRIVSVGGDGTNNEVINGFFDGTKPVNPRASFGFIPIGTGGDFRKTFGWSKEFPDALDRLESGKERTIDLGRMTCFTLEGDPLMRHFINITSFGLGGQVDHNVNTSSKALGGKTSFFLGSLKAVLGWTNKSLLITLDDGEPFEQTIANVVCANGRVFGGGMQIAPKADVADGQFDVVVLGDFSLPGFLKLSGKIYKGEHLGNPKVSFTRAARVEAKPANPDDQVLIDMDGEMPGQLPITLEILPGALNLVG